LNKPLNQKHQPVLNICLPDRKSPATHELPALLALPDENSPRISIFTAPEKPLNTLPDLASSLVVSAI
jgi:hypothetical protein